MRNAKHMHLVVLRRFCKILKNAASWECPAWVFRIMLTYLKKASDSPMKKSCEFLFDFYKNISFTNMGKPCVSKWKVKSRKTLQIRFYVDVLKFIVFVVLHKKMWNKFTTFLTVPTILLHKEESVSVGQANKIWKYYCLYNMCKIVQ